MSDEKDILNALKASIKKFEDDTEGEPISCRVRNAIVIKLLDQIAIAEKNIKPDTEANKSILKEIATIKIQINCW